MASLQQKILVRTRLFHEGLALFAAVAAPLALYASTLPRSVVFEDDGSFLMVGHHFGIAHPPGYPIYTLILHLFMQIPVGNPATLGHFLSAVFGALSCGSVMICARLLGASTILALAAGWLFAASEHVWSQAIITEVYSFNAFLFFSLYALILYAVRRNVTGNGLWLSAAAIYGIGLANHWPLMVLAGPGLLVAAVPARKAILPKLPLLVGVTTLVAAVPYLLMAWRSHQNPLTSFYGPIRVFGSISDPRSLLFFVSRRAYSDVDTVASAGWSDRSAYLQWFGQEILSQLTLLGVAIAILALVMLLRSRRWTQAGAGILVFLAHSVVLIVLLRFDFDYSRVALFRPYSLVCYGLAAIWLSIGVQFVVGRHDGWVPFSIKLNARRRTLVGAVAVVAIAAWSVRENWEVNDRSDSDVAARAANLVLQNLPDDAIMIAEGDMEAFTLGYLHFVEGIRPDITLLSSLGLAYANRLFHPSAPADRRTEILRQFVTQTDRRVFVSDAHNILSLCDGCGMRMFGFVAEALRGGSGFGTVEMRRVPEAEDFFSEMVDAELSDAWEYGYRTAFLERYGSYLGILAASDNPAARRLAEPLLPAAVQDYHCLTGMVNATIPDWTPETGKLIVAWLEKARRLLPSVRLTKREHGLHYYLGGLVELKRGDRQAAKRMFSRSVEIYNSSGNPSLGELRALARSGAG